MLRRESLSRGRFGSDFSTAGVIGVRSSLPVVGFCMVGITIPAEWRAGGGTGRVCATDSVVVRTGEAECRCLGWWACCGACNDGVGYLDS